MRRTPRMAVIIAGAVSSLVLGAAAPALARTDPTASTTTGSSSRGSTSTQQLAPRTYFTMAPDGSSGLTQGGAGIPNIDSVKKTIYAYYGDPGTGIANQSASPYISELDRLSARVRATLKARYRQSVKEGKKPAIVLDADDTTLWTYDMEVHDMKFVFDPVLQDEWVQDQRFPATPGMVRLVNEARAMGFTIFGLTGRNNGQKAATVANLAKVGYRGFTPQHYFTKWRSTDPIPAYMAGKCVNMAACTTVEYKAGTRRHIEKDLGYDITLNLGDQWSDLMGGYADHNVKLPNPTYYLPSPNLPGKSQPWLAPRTHFAMAPDGSSGLHRAGDAIPNIDSVKKTIYAYYGDPGTGISNKVSSPYISELASLETKQTPRVVSACRQALRQGKKPAVVFDGDDTTLWTYDMEVHDMKFVFDPVRQDYWVQNKLFPATPGMPSLVAAVDAAGCQVIGLTGRNNGQKDATIANLNEQGFPQFTGDFYFTKWRSTDPVPAYMAGKCADPAHCTTIEFKSATRAYIESRQFGRYDIVANFGDQFSDLIGGHADRAVKLPNPTYYLP